MQEIDLIQKSQDITVESFDDTKGEFIGYASVYGNIDRQGDIIEKNALKEFVEEWKAGLVTVPLDNEHNSNTILAFNVKEISHDNNGVPILAQIDKNIVPPDLYKDIAKACKEGKGFLSGTFTDNKGIDFSIKKNGRSVAGKQGLRYVIRKTRLKAVSFTRTPANTLAEIEIFKSIEEFDDILKNVSCFSRAEEFLRKNSNLSQKQCGEFLKTFQGVIEKRNLSPAQDCQSKEPAQVQNDEAQFWAEVANKLNNK